MNALYWIILMTFVNGMLGLIGVFSFFIQKTGLDKIVLILVSFATGSLLGGTFFHLIPESLEKISLIPTIILGFIGILLFYSIEKFLHWHHCHEGKDCKHPISYLATYGDAIHNFIDGLLIASSFLVSIPLGIITSILIILHELPQEIGNFAVVVYGGFKRKKAIIYSFLAQLTSIIGGVLGYFFLSLQDYSSWLLSLTAGGFLYISLIDLIPEIVKEKRTNKIIINIIAIIIGIAITISAKILIE
jgi:zinc and cadmium transporter